MPSATTGWLKAATIAEVGSTSVEPSAGRLCNSSRYGLVVYDRLIGASSANPLIDCAEVAILMVRDVSGNKAESGVKMRVESSCQVKLPERVGSPLRAASTEACCIGWLK